MPKNAHATVLCKSSGHSPALLGAPLAGLGTFLAMVVVMFTAFSSAGLTDFGAEATKLRGELGITAHQAGGHPAE